MDIRRTYLSETHKSTQQSESRRDDRKVRWCGESAHSRRTVGSIPTRLFSMLYSIQNQSQEVLSLILDLSTFVNDEKYINISAGWTDHIVGLD